MRAARARLRPRAVPVHARRAPRRGRERARHQRRARRTGGAAGGSRCPCRWRATADGRGRRGRGARGLALRPHLPAGAAADGGAPTTYDAVRRVQEHLRAADSPTASARRPAATRSRRSCSRTGSATASSSPGAMALMLRMSGIPARVVSGFSPGLVQPRHRRVPRARPGRPLLGRGATSPSIGWVTFDPTPPAAPADRAGQGPDGPLGERPRPRCRGAATRRCDVPPTPGADAAADGGGGGGSGLHRRRPAVARDRDPAALAAAGAAAGAGRRAAMAARARDAEAGLRELRARAAAARVDAARRHDPAGARAQARRARPGPRPPGTWRGCAPGRVRRRGAADPPGRRPRRAAARADGGGRPARPACAASCALPPRPTHLYVV